MHHLKNLLQSAGISCRIKNEDLVRLAGEVPFPECALQLVPEREEDTPAAEKLIAEFLRPRLRQGKRWNSSIRGDEAAGPGMVLWEVRGKRQNAVRLLGAWT